MKAFFEEYGFVMLSAIVVIALITIATGLQTTVTNGITNIMSGFETKVIKSGNFDVPSSTPSEG